MQIVSSPSETRRVTAGYRREGLKVGLVPTMGYLHEGHLELVRRARAENDRVVMSIFVNPTQFGQGEDYEAYPRDLERDAALAESEGVDLIFNPTASAMYPEGYQTYIEVEELSQGLCGASRPGHFRGVATVVLKLFNIVGPDRAYFGQKDYQQSLVVRKMVEDLNVPVEIVTVPIVREEDGLAMSSRNTYLSDRERRAATVLYRALREAERAARAGERNADRLRELMVRTIGQEPLAEIDYAEVADAQTLTPLTRLEGPAALLLAVRIGRTRLIDNTVLEV